METRWLAFNDNIYLAFYDQIFLTAPAIKEQSGGFEYNFMKYNSTFNYIYKELYAKWIYTGGHFML